MERSRPLRRRIAASIACLVFVLQGFVPLLAQATASAARTQFPQFHLGALCSIDPVAARARLEKMLDDEAPVPVPSSFGAAHCPFCALPGGADAPTPPSFGWRIPDANVGALPLPAVSLAASPTGPLRGRPQTPRAPPRS
ncbi:MAG: hypothetical protein ROZ64_10350 [Burkholderiaceae bacterium]|nr:hypothetical protein [Burkholderiaceae bacterium]